MGGSTEFSVASAVTLVLGGIAAFVLALTIALGGYGQGRAKRASTALSAEPARSAAPAASGEYPSEAEIEYLLDTGEPSAAAGRPP